MNPRAPSQRGAALRAHPRRASGIAARPKSGRLRRVGRIALYGVIGFIISSIVLVALYRALPPPGTPLMLVRLVEGYGIDKNWRLLDDISPHLIRAAMAGEDARFCRHHGFDWCAIATAWDHYQSGHGRLLGASTISMQTAKNVFLWPGRDWLRKGFEAWFTTLIELAWGKRRIMEVYLNVLTPKSDKLHHIRSEGGCGHAVDQPSTCVCGGVSPGRSRDGGELRYSDRSA